MQLLSLFKKTIGVLLLFGLSTQILLAEKIYLSSSKQQTTMIELYSSEGCSSCPPADQFLSQFTESEELWTEYIPMAFHVDYWDYLGWKDVFASPTFSNRQRTHKQQGNLSSVYTPGFVINGNEWAGFFKPWRSLPKFDSKPGILKVSIDRHSATISFPATKQKLQYNLAVLGMGLVTDVRAGENSGNQLPHDFVVLDHQHQVGLSSISLNLPLIVGKNPKQFAIVAWITLPDSLQPIQAVGGILPEGTIKSI